MQIDVSVKNPIGRSWNAAISQNPCSFSRLRRGDTLRAGRVAPRGRGQGPPSAQRTARRSISEPHQIARNLGVATLGGDQIERQRGELIDDRNGARVLALID